MQPAQGPVVARRLQRRQRDPSLAQHAEATALEGLVRRGRALHRTAPPRLLEQGRVDAAAVVGRDHLPEAHAMGLVRFAEAVSIDGQARGRRADVAVESKPRRSDRRGVGIG